MMRVGPLPELYLNSRTRITFPWLNRKDYEPSVLLVTGLVNGPDLIRNYEFFVEANGHFRIRHFDSNAGIGTHSKATVQAEILRAQGKKDC